VLVACMCCSILEVGGFNSANQDSYKSTNMSVVPPLIYEQHTSPCHQFPEESCKERYYCFRGVAKRIEA
jgi:hypothetical protein